MLTSTQNPSSTPVAANAPLSAIGRADASSSVPGTGSNYTSNNSSGFMGKMKLQYVLGGLLIALIAIGSGVGFWLSQQSQDVRQQASTGYGGCTSVGQCVGGGTCSPTDVATGAGSGSGASCGGSNNTSNCGANGQAPCSSGCDSGLVQQGSICVLQGTTGCSAASGRSNGCTCSSSGQCGSGVCGASGVCVPQQVSGTGVLGSACTAATECASGYCNAGTCQVAPQNVCSPLNPNGICPSGQTCDPVAGVCVSPALTQCSSSNPNGSCPSGQTCQSGQCVSSGGTGGTGDPNQVVSVQVVTSYE